MRLSLMKAAHAGVGGAPCRKSGYVGRKRWAKPTTAFTIVLTNAGCPISRSFFARCGIPANPRAQCSGAHHPARLPLGHRRGWPLLIKPADSYRAARLAGGRLRPVAHQSPTQQFVNFSPPKHIVAKVAGVPKEKPQQVPESDKAWRYATEARLPHDQAAHKRCQSHTVAPTPRKEKYSQ